MNNPNKPVDGIAAGLKLTKARVQMVMAHPFFATLTLKMRMVGAPGIKDHAGQPTPMAVDGFHLFYNPERIDQFSVENCKWLTAKEVMHCANLHHLRRGDRDPQKWQRACDEVVKLLLEDSECGVRPDSISPPNHAYADMAVEEVYAKLPDGDDQGGGGAAGIVIDAPKPPGRGDSGNGKSDKEQQDGEGQPQEGDGDGDGQGDGDQDPQPGQGPAPSQSEKDEMESEWKLRVAEAAQVAKSAGKLPSNLERFAEGLIEPELDWRELLRRFMTSTKEDYQWLPPSRRHVWRGMYLPSLRSEGIRQAVIAVDTSGSIGPDELRDFATEISGILSEFPGCEITVIYCDAGVAHVEKFTHDDLPLKLDARGGGGTAFEPVFDYISEEQIDPDFVVYLTDLFGNTHFPAPDYPVMWVTTGSTEADWGEVIVLKPEEGGAITRFGRRAGAALGVR